MPLSPFFVRPRFVHACVRVLVVFVAAVFLLIYSRDGVK